MTSTPARALYGAREGTEARGGDHLDQRGVRCGQVNSGRRAQPGAARVGGREPGGRRRSPARQYARPPAGGTGLPGLPGLAPPDRSARHRAAPPGRRYRHRAYDHLLDGRVDATIACAKDLPGPHDRAPGTAIDAVLPREVVRDVLVLPAGHRPVTLAELPPGTRVGTSAPHALLVAGRVPAPGRHPRIDRVRAGGDALLRAPPRLAFPLS
ncbi:hypothetical protein [Streptomyces goshikiensis]|uniref:hypothetical protein n=1 Tax=Streptomyces goshikiensis TaxID=1942 RepID=UPI00365310B1